MRDVPLYVFQIRVDREMHSSYRECIRVGIGFKEGVLPLPECTLRVALFCIAHDVVYYD